MASVADLSEQSQAGQHAVKATCNTIQSQTRYRSINEAQKIVIKNLTRLHHKRFLFPSNSKEVRKLIAFNIARRAFDSGSLHVRGSLDGYRYLPPLPFFYINLLTVLVGGNHNGLASTEDTPISYLWCCGECSEAKDHVEQLSKIKECIVQFCMLLWPPFVWPQPGSVHMTYL
jgi:hypothetical protein